MSGTHRDHTMTPQEEAEWEAQMKRGGVADESPPRNPVGERRVQPPPASTTRKRAYAVEELWEKWAVFQSKYPNVRDGAEFLLSLEKEAK